MADAELTLGSAEPDHFSDQDTELHITRPRQARVPTAGAQHPRCQKIVQKILKLANKGRKAYGLELAAVFLQPDSFGQLGDKGVLSYGTPHLLSVTDGAGNITDRCVTAYNASLVQTAVRDLHTVLLTAMPL